MTDVGHCGTCGHGPALHMGAGRCTVCFCERFALSGSPTVVPDDRKPLIIHAVQPLAEGELREVLARVASITSYPVIVLDNRWEVL